MQNGFHFFLKTTLKEETVYFIIKVSFCDISLLSVTIYTCYKFTSDMGSIVKISVPKNITEMLIKC